VLNDVAFDNIRESRSIHPADRLSGGATRNDLSRSGGLVSALERLGFTALTTTTLDPVLIATEGAQWGSIDAHRFLRAHIPNWSLFPGCAHCAI
jgi:hypothetical protein